MNDAREYIIIEPHMLRTRNNLINALKNPLSGPDALKPNEIDFLEKNSNNQSKILLVDFYPYSDLGSGRIEILKNRLGNKEIYFILRKRSFEEQLNKYNLSYLLFDENFTLSDTNTNDLEINNYREFKLKYIEQKILQWIKEATIKSKNNELITLQDGTKANMWIDIKSLLEDPEKSFYIAYQIGYLISKGYVDLELKGIDGFIVANNNSLPIASLLSIFFEKTLFIVDKLGPSPRIIPKWLIEMRDKLEGKKVIVIEDVISTGREVDLLYFFLIYHRAEVKKIISVVDLLCARPVLLKQHVVLPLCRPSKSLKYERILAYQKED